MKVRALRGSARRGFTMVELAVVVAIIGVVAVLAAVGFAKWRKSARMAEATEMVSSIKNAQENYNTQVGHYFDLSKGLTAPNLYPIATPQNGAVGHWGAACGVCNDPNGWNRLGIVASGNVRWGYATMAGPDTQDPSARGLSFSNAKGVAYNWTSLAGGAITNPWFIVTAMSDFDGDGKYSTVVGGSFFSQVLADEEP